MDIIIIDPGHGGVKDGVLQTPGKKWSPKGVEGLYTHDGRFIEGLFNRALAKRVADGLDALGYHIVWSIGSPDNQNDVPLGMRTKVAIDLQKAAKEGDRLLFVSIHANALGNGETWQAGSGWEVLIQKGLADNTRSAAAAKYVALAYVNAGIAYRGTTGKAPLRLRQTTHLLPYKQQDLQVLRETSQKGIPGLLTENGFMDNRADLAYLQSPTWMDCLTQAHVKGVDAYFKAL